MMNKVRIAAFMAALGGSLLAIAPAWTETQPMPAAVIGQVITADAARQELTIKDEATQNERTFKVLNPAILEELKSGDRVQVSTADEKTAESVSKA